MEYSYKEIREAVRLMAEVGEDSKYDRDDIDSLNKTTYEIAVEISNEITDKNYR